jgi:hypothetical protein
VNRGRIAPRHSADLRQRETAQAERGALEEVAACLVFKVSVSHYQLAQE